MSNSLKQSSIIFVTALLIFAGFFSSALSQNNLLAPGDALTYSLPAFSSPLTPWSDLLGCGVPISADPQYQMWYPVRVLCRYLLDYNAFVILGYVVAACTSFALAFTLTRSRVASVIAALTYSMSGFMFAHLGHVTIVHAAAWLPLFLFSINKISRNFKWRWLLTGELAIAACMLGGHSQILLMQLVSGASYAVFLACSNKRSTPRIIVSFSLMCILGLALVALQLLPTLELVSFSPRNSWSFDSFVSFSLPPRQLAEFFFPFLFFKPAGYALQSYGQSAYFGEWSVTELAGYVGILPLVLSLVALIRGKGSDRFFWLVTAVVSLVIAAGSATPLAKLLFHVPIINHFRCPARYVLLFDLAIAMLAAYGAAAIERMAVFRSRQIAVAFASFLAAVLGLASFVWCLKFLRNHFSPDGGALPVDLSPVSNAHVGVPLALFVLSIAVALFWASDPKRSLARILLLLILFLDLSSFDFFCEWRFRTASKDVLTAPPAVLKILQELQGNVDGGFRVIAPLADLGGLKCCPPNLTSLWGLPSAAYYSPMCTARMTKLMHDAGTARLQLLCRDQDAAADLASVKYLLLPHGTKPQDVTSDANAVSAERFLPIRTSDPNISVYINKRFLPRFRFVSKVVPLADEVAQQAIETSMIPGAIPFEPATVAILPLEVTAESRFHLNGEKTNQDNRLKLLQDDPQRKRMEVTCAENSLLVISEQYYPGWSATIDGRSAQLRRANFAFQGLFVDRGRHIVELNYRSKSLELGLAISAFVLVLNIGGVLHFGRRR